MADFFSKLSESQKSAVSTTDGPLLVVAGPGTGKTLTVVRRIAHFIQQGIRPENILAVTFTNRAAREMKERAEELIGECAANIFIGTFHLLGLRVIRDHCCAEFIIYSRDEQLELLKLLLGTTAKKAQQAAEKISRVKNFLEEADADTHEILAVYQSALKQRNAFDFDDLIRISIDMLENSDALKKQYQDQFEYIIVDEYQDINPAQYRFLKLLAGNNRNICAVGDADQAIYAFRGADIQNFLNFEVDFPSATRVALSENYRSTGIILEAAEGVIKINRARIDKKLIPTRGKGARISRISVPDERAEGSAIVRAIETRIGGTSHYEMERGNAGSADLEQSFRFSDFAVVFRTNAQAKALEEAFSASGIPYQLIGGQNSAQMQAGSETIAYLRSLIPSETKTTLPMLPGGAQEAKLLGPADFFNPRSDAVTLMTLHMAKGLEFPVVFITGCEDGLIPYTIMKDRIDIEEERRLFYVGLTRAKDELFILSSRRRFLYGQRLQPIPSPFLAEIPEALVEHATVPDKVKEPKKKEQQLGLF